MRDRYIPGSIYRQAGELERPSEADKSVKLCGLYSFPPWAPRVMATSLAFLYAGVVEVVSGPLCSVIHSAFKHH